MHRQTNAWIQGMVRDIYRHTIFKISKRFIDIGGVFATTKHARFLKTLRVFAKLRRNGTEKFGDFSRRIDFEKIVYIQLYYLALH